MSLDDDVDDQITDKYNPEEITTAVMLQDVSPPIFARDILSDSVLDSLNQMTSLTTSTSLTRKKRKTRTNSLMIRISNLSPNPSVAASLAAMKKTWRSSVESMAQRTPSILDRRAPKSHHLQSFLMQLIKRKP